MPRPGTSTRSARAARRTAAMYHVAPLERVGSFAAYGVETRAEARPSYSDAMDGVVYRAGEGEALFGGRIVIKADFDELCITESLFGDARDGASPHYHRHHADSFYVLEGGLAVLIKDEEKMLAPARRPGSFTGSGARP